MKINSDDFRVRAGARVKLHKWPTRVMPICRSRNEYRAMLAEHGKEMNSLQSRLYADSRYAVLFILQAMDAAGKDGVIKHGAAILEAIHAGI